MVLFPGSVLFRRDDAKRRSGAEKPDKAAKRGPRWIMAAEIMETSRLYARTCAKLDPLWALELGSHLLRIAHSEPFWNEANGRVMVKQRSRLYGLELESRGVSYGRIDPVHATEIFIREGLVNDTITFPLDFLTHNRAVRENLADLLTRARDSGYLNLDEAAYRFYAGRLLPEAGEPPAVQGERLPGPTPAGSMDRGRPARNAGISSVAELVDLVRQRQEAEPRFLFMTPEDLRDPETIPHDATAFPAALPVDNRVLPLHYAYKPGQAEDGVTVQVSVREAEALTPAALDWAVPGHLEAKVEHYLRALPKELRRAFVPLAETAKTLAAQVAARDRLTDRREALPEALAAQIAERFRVAIDPGVWADKPLPDHLRVRIRVVDAAGRELIASRELPEIRGALLAQSREASKAVAHEEPVAWRSARAQWETPEFAQWTFDAVPERVLVAEQGGTPVYAFPGLLAGAAGVARRLFKTPEEAVASSRHALSALLERQLGHDLMWTQRDLRALREVGPLTATLAPVEQLQEQAFETLRRWVTSPRRVLGTAATAAEVAARLTAGQVTAAVEKAKQDLRGLVPRFVDLVKEILTWRQELLVLRDPPAGMAAELEALLPGDFLRRTPYEQLVHFPRYLKAKKLRAERWRKHPGKDAERAAQLAPHERAVVELRRARKVHDHEVEAFRWLVEELRVGLFAQELGTAEPVSVVKLERVLASLRGTGSGQPGSAGQAAAAAPKPIVAAPIVDEKKKAAPLKNLGALDKLFGR